MPQDPGRDERLAQAVLLAQALLGEAEHLNKETGGQIVSLSRTARVNRRLIWVTVAGFALDLALTVAVAVGALQIGSLTHRLDVAQTVQRQKALCPLYQVFLDSKSPAARKAAEDPIKYDHAFKVIQDGYNVLECSAYINQAVAVP
jgi:hypothetical protein